MTMGIIMIIPNIDKQNKIKIEDMSRIITIIIITIIIIIDKVKGET